MINAFFWEKLLFFYIYNLYIFIKYTLIIKKKLKILEGPCGFATATMPLIIMLQVKILMIFQRLIIWNSVLLNLYWKKLTFDQMHPLQTWAILGNPLTHFVVCFLYQCCLKHVFVKRASCGFLSATAFLILLIFQRLVKLSSRIQFYLTFRGSLDSRWVFLYFSAFSFLHFFFFWHAFFPTEVTVY